MLGFMQREGVDFYETFSPVVRWGVVRLLLAMWTVRDWPVAEKVDLKQAFNSTPIDVPMYVKQPPGHAVKGEEDKVWRIKKSLPGGRQCSRMLHLALKNLVIKSGFQQCVTEECIFIHRDNKDRNKFIILVVWVDDMFFFANDDSMRRKIDAVCNDLRGAKYVIHRLGDITESHVLGCEVKRNRATRRATITQSDFVAKLLRTTTNAVGVSFWDAPIKKKVRSPVSSEVKTLEAADNAQSSEERIRASEYNYLSKVMSLMYLSLITRPDIAFAVNVAARFVGDPGPKHIAWVERIFEYVSATRMRGLVYEGKDSKLCAYSDASWLDELDMRHTTMGRSLHIGRCLIDWRTQLIKRVMTSTNHAEFFAQNECTKEVLGVQNLLCELGFEPSDGTKIMVDNEGAYKLAKGLLSHTSSRHYDLNLFFQREQSDLGKIRFVPVKTGDQLADMFTKGLCGTNFSLMRDILMGAQKD